MNFDLVYMVRFKTKDFVPLCNELQESSSSISSKINVFKRLDADYVLKDCISTENIDKGNVQKVPSKSDSMENDFISITEHEDKLKKAFSEGYNKAKIEIESTKHDNASNINMMIARIQSDLSKLTESISKEFEIGAKVISKLSLSIGSKLAQKIINEHEFINKTIAKVLHELRDKPSIIIEVNEACMKRVQDSLSEFSFSMPIEIRIDKSLGKEDCCISWDGGKLENIFSNKICEIEKILDDNLEFIQNENIIKKPVICNEVLSVRKK